MLRSSTEPIEQINLGDEVWAADPETGEAGARPVTALIEGEGVKDLVTVSTGSGSVVATAGHPFWSVSDAAWVDAGDLSVGDAVLEADGATSVVTAVSEASRQAVVHNLTVADLHTYFVVVGDAPTLVHNCGGSASSAFLGNATIVSGRFPRTALPESVLARADADGAITNYQVYDMDGLPVMRVDLTGRPHGGVETPHVVEFERHVNPATGEVFVKEGSTVRPAEPWEIPD